MKNENKLRYFLNNLLVISFMAFVTTLSIAQQGVGKQLSQDSMALVGYLELSNIGSKDADCKGTPFEVSNVNSVIETDIRAALNKLSAMENRSNPKEIDEMIVLIKQISSTTKDGKTVLQATYDKAKQDNFATYGKQGGCASMSASFRTVAQQRRLSIQQFLSSKK
jgi:hypothetical protein